MGIVMLREEILALEIILGVVAAQVIEVDMIKEVVVVVVVIKIHLIDIINLIDAIIKGILKNNLIALIIIDLRIKVVLIPHHVLLLHLLLLLLLTHLREELRPLQCNLQLMTLIVSVLVIMFMREAVQAQEAIEWGKNFGNINLTFMLYRYDYDRNDYRNKRYDDAPAQKPDYSRPARRETRYSPPPPPPVTERRPSPPRNDRYNRSGGGGRPFE